MPSPPRVSRHVPLRHATRSGPMGRPAAVPPRAQPLSRRIDSMTPRPFFGSSQGLGPAGPRLVLISYHFLPAQTAGALRWEKLCHYASERGWAMDVVTLDPSSLSILDTSRMATLPPGIRVYGIADPTLP